jgi:hypothetical protein
LYTSAAFLPHGHERKASPQYMAASLNFKKNRMGSRNVNNIFVELLSFGRKQIMVDFPHKVLCHPWNF